ncbi:hypothetical protein [Polaribacter porphyrae]|uniref:Lipoprotein n=1 Tax=Polaribacter porphyrae TaxID=1137780 RepID=A0A2S7WLZ2_9FLAO|nr:hypothetical protein [Polaribacter porphyrae]PQJ78620.1 hypothetical protein BTO18_05200 [Polaribacter porphyrae]
MKTSIQKENILKSSILFFTISAFILSALLFTSCSDNEGIEVNDDTVLIEKIESASKTEVDATSLPVATASTLNGDLADSFVETVQLANGLGFKVSVDTFNESREEEKSDVFFSLEGRQLNDTDEKRKRKRNKCFEFVFPIDFIMPDDSSITLNSKDDWSLIKDWYEANPDADERPELVFPVDVTLKEDGSTQTLIDIDELKTIKNSCKRSKDKRKCFKLVLPVTFTMPDASTIEVTERAGFKLLREWHKANPDATEKGALNFPVDVEYRDGTTATVNDETEYEAAKDSCRD